MAKESKIKEKYTKYEIARILGARALQISMNAPLLLKISKEKLEEIRHEPFKIAKLEFESNVLPITVRRPLPKKIEAAEVISPEIEELAEEVEKEKPAEKEEEERKEKIEKEERAKREAEAKKAEEIEKEAEEIKKEIEEEKEELTKEEKEELGELEEEAEAIEEKGIEAAG